MTYLLTWSAWFFAAYLSGEKQRGMLFGFMMILGLAAPFLTAIGLIWTANNKELKKRFWNKLFNIRLIKLSTIPFMILIMPFAIAVSICISLLFGFSLDQFQLADRISFSTGVFSPLLAFFFIACFEELGWRGYAIEGIQQHFNYFLSTLIFGSLWSLWHLPLFFISNSYHNNILNENVWFAVNFFLSVMPLAFIIGWFYQLNHESILSAILFHFIISFFQEAFQVSQLTKCIETGVLAVIAICIVMLNKKKFSPKL